MDHFESGALDFGDDFRAPPASYAFTCTEPFRQSKPRPKGGPSKPRTRSRRPQRAEPGGLDSEEAAQLEAQLGVSAADLPPHLRSYALQRRNAASFSGPGVLPGEQEAGRVEYKLRLADPTPARFQQLVTQLNWRLSEGAGECLYALGVEDNGHPRGLEEGELQTSLEVLAAMAAEVGAATEVLQMPPGSGEGRRCAVVRVAQRSSPPLPTYTDLRVAVAGGVDSGKSTLVGVLSHGAGGAPALDNGRGSSRMQVFRHKHEIESGHTSSISLQQLAYDAEGAVLNYAGLAPGSGSPADVSGAAARVLRFFDLGGHERFSKTALHGLTCMLPDYAMLCVNAVTGVSWVTREHLAVAIALGISLFVALTKTDLASEAAVQSAAGEIRALLAAAVEQGGGHVADPAALAPLVRSEAEAARLAAAIRHRGCIAAPGASLCVPLFTTSAVTGASLQLLHRFLHALQPSCGTGTSSSSSKRGESAGSEGMQGWLHRAAARSRSLGETEVSSTGDSGSSSSSTGRQGQGQGQQAGQAPAHFQIDNTFEVAGTGTVFSGTVVSGRLAVGDELLLGPLEGGSFQRVLVSSIHRSKVAVPSAQQGQHATVAVLPLEGRPAGAGGGGGLAGGEGRAGAEEDAEEEEDLPARTDSAGCLHAWMRQSASTGHLLQASPVVPRPDVPLPAGQPHELHCSRSAAQLCGASGRQQRQQEGEQASTSRPSWEGLHHWASSPQLQTAGSGAAPRPRKGAVLLGPALEPRACVEFTALLVLLGGHWPARGLLSGRYPPEGELDEPDPCLASPQRASRGGSVSYGSSGRSPAASGAASDSADGGDGGEGGAGRAGSLGGRPRSLGKRSGSQRRVGLSYIPVVHCGSIRQAAQVVGMHELPPAQLGGAAAAGGEEGEADDPFGGLLDGGLEAASPTGPLSQEQQHQQDEEEDALSALLSGLDLGPEPLGSASSVGNGAAAGSSSVGGGQAPRPRPDRRRLAGAVAAAGVLLPQAPLGASQQGSSCTGGTPSCASGSSGHASGGEGAGGSRPGLPPAPAAAGPASPGRQLAAALKRQPSLLGCEDIGCVAEVTFRFMHNPEWLVEGARLIVRDRTTGRTSGAGYVTACTLLPASPDAS